MGTGVKVRLVNHTPRPLETITWAALISYWREWETETFEKVNEGDVRVHLPRVLSHGHESILEHAVLTFAIEGCSRVCSHQLVRHRLASYTQQSQRYVNVDSMDVEEAFVIPPEVRDDPELLRDWRRLLEKSVELYRKTMERGKRLEDARFILPQGIKTKLVVTMNLRELKHFLGLRACERAQWEIREVAWEMLEEVARNDALRPVIKWARLGPRCIQLGYCPEGELMPEGCWRRTRDRWMGLTRRHV